MKAGNLSQHIPQYYRDLSIVLPPRCKGANGARHAAVTAERTKLGIKKRNAEETQLQKDQAAKRLHSVQTGVNVYGH